MPIAQNRIGLAAAPMCKPGTEAKSSDPQAEIKELLEQIGSMLANVGQAFKKQGEEKNAGNMAGLRVGTVMPDQQGGEHGRCGGDTHEPLPFMHGSHAAPPSYAQANQPPAYQDIGSAPPSYPGVEGGQGGGSQDKMMAMMQQMIVQQQQILMAMMAQSGMSTPQFPDLEQAHQSQHSGAICPCEDGQEQPQPEIDAEQKMSRMDAVSTLERHQDKFKKATDRKGMEKMMNDKDTPADLKAALKTMLSDDELMGQLDSAKNGKKDGKVSSKDIRKMAENPELKAYNNEKAQGYVENYVPSDDLSKKPRPMTEHDAQTELYKYADYLPKNVSLDELQKIVDGTTKMGKCPPQLIAAAKYYTDHPDQWKAMNDGKDKVSTAKMEDNISNKQQLSQPQSDALNRLSEDPTGAFFKSGKLNREKLQKIADDPKADPKDKDTANTLLKDEVLFSKIDNGKNGRDIHGIKSLWLKSDDATISKDDVNAMVKKTKDKPVWQEPAAPETPAAKPGQPLTQEEALKQAENGKATSDMVNSGADAEEIKKGKGGFLKDVGENIKHGFEKIGEGFKKIGEGIKHFGEGAIKAIGGAFKVVGGALTFNGDLIKKGANDVKNGGKEAWKGIDTAITGTGEVLGGAAGAAVAISPAGMAINHMTNNAGSRLAEGTFEGMADTIVKGRNGLINAGEAAVKGDWKGVGKGIYDTANLAMMFVPGAGQANMARNVGTQFGKELVKDGVKGSVKDEVKNQYEMAKGDNKPEGAQA